MNASSGLPSTYSSADSTDSTPPSHRETARDALIDSHTTGIQRAEDTRNLLSRSNSKSARMKKPQTTVAMLGDIHNLLMRARDKKREVIQFLTLRQKQPYTIRPRWSILLSRDLPSPRPTL